jgi:hypothetical protein
MIEIRFIEPDHVKFSAVVVAVAGGAILPPYIFGIMKTSSLVESGLNFFVAIEAFVIGYFMAKLVALGAIGNAFEVGMWAGQISGGDLASCICHEKQAENSYG